MHRNVRAVVDAAGALGFEVHPREYPAGTRSAADAARCIGVELGQIVKSLVFNVDGETVVALMSGANRVDEATLARVAGGERAWREDAVAVRQATGFPVGGIPPFGHRQALRTFVDEDLLGYDELWAAAGTPMHNFPIPPDTLVRMTGGRVCPLAAR